LFRRPIDTSPDFTLFLYRNDPCVVIGRNQNPWRECNVPLLNQTHTPLIRRRSGGGTVYHDLGNTNYSIHMPRNNFSRTLYAHLITQALHDLDIPASVNDRHDILVEGKKVSGSAYKVVNARAYHHGTMLIDTDLDRLRGVLRPSNVAARIEGAGVRSVPSPVTRLREWSMTVSHGEFCRAVVRRFQRHHATPQLLNFDPLPDIDYHPLTPPDIHTLTHGHAETIADVRKHRDETTTWEWTFGQTPRFTVSLLKAFEGFGEVRVVLEVVEGVVVGCVVSAGGWMEVGTLEGVRVGVVGRRFGEDVGEWTFGGVEGVEVWEWVRGEVKGGAL
ncbi:Biotin/lipoate A/B protein ligase, partial [Dinochytrium kinnereticum]